MCRLFTYRSNVPRSVECELFGSANSLLVQSRRDERGIRHAHGWGFGSYTGDRPAVVRQTRPAFKSARFRRDTASVRSGNILAHVRNATIGSVAIDNTHPFRHGPWTFAHNGTVKTFAAIRPLMLSAMGETHRKAIRGQTDSEHVFHFLLSVRDHNPEMALPEAAREATRQIIDWSRAEDKEAELGLNFILTDGEDTVGLCYGQSLWYTVRSSEYRCADCTCSSAVRAGSHDSFRAVIISSEKITQDETWIRLSDGELIHVDARVRLEKSTV